MRYPKKHCPRLIASIRLTIIAGNTAIRARNEVFGKLIKTSLYQENYGLYTCPPNKSSTSFLQIIYICLVGTCNCSSK
jgi:hypothetical protein